MVVLGLIISFTHSAFSTVLNVPQVFQQQTQWCWAGTTQAVFQFYGIHLSQPQIAQFGSGGRNEWIYLYGQSGFRSSIKNIFNHWGVASQPFPRALTTVEAKQQMLMNKPVIVRWGWRTGGGHFVILRGLNETNNQAFIMDPWFGKGHQIVNINWLKNSRRHAWTHSLTTAR